MDKQRADQRVRELGERMGIPALALDEGNSALIGIENGPVLSVGYAAASGTLQIMVTLDGVAISPSAMYEALGANFAFAETGGGSFAIESKSQALVLQRRLGDSDAEHGGLFAAVEALVAAADAWQLKRLTGGGSASSSSSSGAQAASAIPSGMVRA